MRISNSFSEGEIQVLEFVLQTTLRGGSPVMATRHKDFASLYRKVLAMRQRSTRQPPPKSSTGSVAAEQPAAGTRKAAG
ncbi:MAG: hypothetical protein NZ898_07935 [Myxococcota bacterium]|nr:hypothetical protein [Myxococcota bacterium]MDW8363526.1 hypothetical protein [Myxococcales bacterium]